MTEAITVLSTSVGYALLGVFSVMWIALGIYWGRRAKSLDGFMVAGRNVGLALGTATAVATWITSNTTMLAPQFALSLGVIGMLAYCTASFGLFLFAPLAKRIRQAMPRGYTSVEFIRLRYGKTGYIVFLLISLFYGLTWMVSMGMAGGLLLQALAAIPYAYGMSVILLVCVVYTLFGGLFAVIGTDFIQSLVILTGVVAVAVAILWSSPLREVYSNLETNRPALLNMLFPAAIMSVFNNLLFGIGEIFHSNVWWSRAFAMREGIGMKAYMLAGVIWLPIPVVAGFLGLAAPSLGIHITRPDVVGPLVAADILGSFGGILVFIVVFCSLASSIDSLLAATSDVVTKEVVQPVFLPNATDAQIRKVASGVIVIVGFITWLICLQNIGTLADVLFFAGPLVGSTIWPIITGLFWKKANKQGAIAAMIVGAAIGLYVYWAIGWYAATLVGTTVSFVIVMVTTYLRPQTFDWQTLAAGKKELSS